MIGCEDDGVVAIGQSLEQFSHDGVAEPGERDAAVGTLVVGQLANHLRFCASMREHVDEVDNDDVEIVVFQTVVLLQQALRLPTESFTLL